MILFLMHVWKGRGINMNLTGDHGIRADALTPDTLYLLTPSEASLDTQAQRGPSA